jgi:hypothetical protein
MGRERRLVVVKEKGVGPQTVREKYGRLSAHRGRRCVGHPILHARPDAAAFMADVLGVSRWTVAQDSFQARLVDRDASGGAHRRGRVRSAPERRGQAARRLLSITLQRGLALRVGVKAKQLIPFG